MYVAVTKMFLYTGCTGSGANPEVSSSDDSATTSGVPAIAFTEPTCALANVEEVVIDQESAQENMTVHDSNAITTQSAEQNTSGRGKPMSIQQSPSRKQNLQMRESCCMVKTPPLNLAMENVSKYIDADKAWLSDGFCSHQIGYRICLAIKIESISDNDGMVNVMLGVISAEGAQSSYLVYPCSGLATVAILNPQANSDHKVLEVIFVLEKPALNSYSEIESELVQVPRCFITQDDCIFFLVEKIDMDDSGQNLWLLDASLVETIDDPQQASGEEQGVSS